MSSDLNIQDNRIKVVVCFTSVSGYTRRAAYRLCHLLEEAGAPRITCYDLAADDARQALTEALVCDTLVLAGSADHGIAMRRFLEGLKAEGFCNRRIALIEGGRSSLSPLVREILSGNEGIGYAKEPVVIDGAIDDEAQAQLTRLAEELTEIYRVLAGKEAETIDPKAAQKMKMGLYAVMTRDGERDNASIISSVSQVCETPLKFSVSVHRDSYTCKTIHRTKKLNLCVLSEDAPKELIARFGFRSGKDTDKFEGLDQVARSSNGLYFLKQYANAYLSLHVSMEISLGSHTMFLCDVTESAVLSSAGTLCYEDFRQMH